MPECKKCGNLVSPARVKLVGKLCLECGDEVANLLTEQRKQQCALSLTKVATSI